MERYVGLDVSLKMTAICIVDRTGKILREGMVASDPDEIATFVTLHAPYVVRIGLETGATSTWMWTELSRRGLPIICIDARHAKDKRRCNRGRTAGAGGENTGHYFVPLLTRPASFNHCNSPGQTAASAVRHCRGGRSLHRPPFRPREV